jgi:hypothetical protein
MQGLSGSGALRLFALIAKNLPNGGLQVVLNRSNSNRNRVANGPRGGTAMSYDTDATSTQKEGTAIFLVVQPLAQPTEGRPHEQEPEFGEQALPDLLSHQTSAEVGEASGQLEDDIASKTITNNNICLARQDVPPFDIPNEIERLAGPGQHLMGGLSQGIAFAGLLPNVQ